MGIHEKVRVLVIFSRPVFLEDGYTDTISDSFGRGASNSVILEFLLWGSGVGSLDVDAETRDSWIRISQLGNNIYALKEDMDDQGIKAGLPNLRIITHNQLPELLDSNYAIVHY